MNLILPQLPYTYGAMEPHTFRSTLEIQHDSHHLAYVDKANPPIGPPRDRGWVCYREKWIDR